MNGDVRLSGALCQLHQQLQTGAIDFDKLAGVDGDCRLLFRLLGRYLLSQTLLKRQMQFVIARADLINRQLAIQSKSRLVSTHIDLKAKSVWKPHQAFARDETV